MQDAPHNIMWITMEIFFKGGVMDQFVDADQENDK